jgi:hypothetical protein
MSAPPGARASTRIIPPLKAQPARHRADHCRCPFPTRVTSTSICPAVQHAATAARYDQCVPFRKSEANVLAMADMTAWFEMISPSSRLSLREVLEKFSEPMNTFAWEVP